MRGVVLPKWQYHSPENPVAASLSQSFVERGGSLVISALADALFFGLLALICVALGIYFAVENSQVISPVIAGYSLQSGSVGVWLICMLLLGVLLGFLASLLPIFSQHRRARGLNKQLKRWSANCKPFTVRLPETDLLDLAYFFFLLTAVAIGWVLGRGSSRRKPDFSEREQSLARSYAQGLNYLLSEHHDDTIEKFIDSLEVSPVTFDTHLALGNLLRRRGSTTRLSGSTRTCSRVPAYQGRASIKPSLSWPATISPLAG